jgi:hypothetical protein
MTETFAGAISGVLENHRSFARVSLAVMAAHCLSVLRTC